MKAMILAAGLGTRLKPLTDSLPKALVEIEGIPMLERVIRNLQRWDVNQFVVNTHHFSDKVKAFIDTNDFGCTIEISDETDALLDTGGGLVKARQILFENDADVLVHNVDIISNADFKDLLKYHRSSGNDVTLLVSPRDSSRKLIFDEDMSLKGWKNIITGEERGPQPLKKEKVFSEFAFSGIYIINSKSVGEMEYLWGFNKKFPIMDYFLSSSRKARIGGFLQSDLKLLDIGKPATLSQANILLHEIE
ncbi:MAG: NTP transferase domain-containing protein [Muribaculaceae bacterium]|nr:NTP transferase domain-containing protein [Muribaculaceae bacterium]